jgi:hypothetical protein
VLARVSSIVRHLYSARFAASARVYLRFYNHTSTEIAGDSLCFVCG